MCFSIKAAWFSKCKIQSDELQTFLHWPWTFILYYNEPYNPVSILQPLVLFCFHAATLVLFFQSDIIYIQIRNIIIPCLLTMPKTHLHQLSLCNNKIIPISIGCKNIQPHPLPSSALISSNSISFATTSALFLISNPKNSPYFLQPAKSR